PSLCQFPPLQGNEIHIRNTFFGESRGYMKEYAIVHEVSHPVNGLDDVRVPGRTPNGEGIYSEKTGTTRLYGIDGAAYAYSIGRALENNDNFVCAAVRCQP
ncbi:MAG: hypothetical protein P8X51_09460, partial [Maritimibacter sp.]